MLLCRYVTSVNQALWLKTLRFEYGCVSRRWTSTKNLLGFHDFILALYSYLYSQTKINEKETTKLQNATSF